MDITDSVNINTQTQHSKPMSRRQALMVLGAAATAIAAAEWLRPRERLAETLGPINLSQSIPSVFGGWSGVDDAPTQIINPELELIVKQKYSDLLNRTYQNRAGYRMLVSVAYGGDQTDAVAVHRPEGCYPAQGFVVERVWREYVKTDYGSVSVNRLITSFGSARPEPVSYWIVIGSRLLRYHGEKKLIDLEFALKNKIPDGLIFRVSSIDPNSASAFLQHDEFIRELLPALSQDMRPRIMGLA
jgi:EpsI family protein